MLVRSQQESTRVNKSQQETTRVNKSQESTRVSERLKSTSDTRALTRVSERSKYRRGKGDRGTRG